ncbi:hypothetical protein A7982_13697 [Minicystis rosea]|nr:hypothetical protein A7982_13697 [Minicystis rosea]
MFRTLQLCAREPVIQQLCTAPGVSLVVAAAFVRGRGVRLGDR